MKIGFLELLTLIFIVLKLIGVITWSWWLVFTPVYAAICIYLLIVGGWAIGFLKLKNKF